MVEVVEVGDVDLTAGDVTTPERCRGQLLRNSKPVPLSNVLIMSKQVLPPHSFNVALHRQFYYQCRP